MIFFFDSSVQQVITLENVLSERYRKKYPAFSSIIFRKYKSDDLLSYFSLYKENRKFHFYRDQHKKINIRIKNGSVVLRNQIIQNEKKI